MMLNDEKRSEATVLVGSKNEKLMSARLIESLLNVFLRTFYVTFSTTSLLTVDGLTLAGEPCVRAEHWHSSFIVAHFW